MLTYLYRSLFSLLATPVLCCVLFTTADAVEKNNTFRIGYFETGPLESFDKTLYALKESLGRSGWLDRVSFPREAFCSPGWAPSDTPKYAACAKKLMERDDLDLIIGMGAHATNALIEYNNKRTPFVGILFSDPISSGITSSTFFSDVPNFTTRVTKRQWREVFTLYHSAVGCSRLGIMYTDTNFGKTRAHLDDALEIARERGFQVIRYDKLDQKQSLDSCMDGVKALLKEKIDAIFLPDMVCMDVERGDPRAILELLNKNKVKTFTTSDIDMIRKGALMSATLSPSQDIGEFFAERIVGILQGRSPGSFNMLATPTLNLALNLETANEIGIDFSLPVLLAADVLIREVHQGEDHLTPEHVKDEAASKPLQN